MCENKIMWLFLVTWQTKGSSRTCFQHKRLHFAEICWKSSIFKRSVRWITIRKTWSPQLIYLIEMGFPFMIIRTYNNLRIWIPRRIWNSQKPSKYPKLDFQEARAEVNEKLSNSNWNWVWEKIFCYCKGRLQLKQVEAVHTETNDPQFDFFVEVVEISSIFEFSGQQNDQENVGLQSKSSVW